MRPNLELLLRVRRRSKARRESRSFNPAYRWVPLWTALLPFSLGMNDQSCVSSHLPDQLVTQSPQQVTVRLRDQSGAAVEGEVELFVGPENGAGQSQGVVATQAGVATFPAVPLQPGLQKLSGRTRRVVDGQEITSEIEPKLITLRTDIRPAGRQEVVFRWEPSADTNLRAIASGTVTPRPSSADADRFVRDVKQSTRDLFTKLYEPFNVALVDQPSPGNDGVVTVKFENAEPLLGSPYGTSIASLAPADIARGIPDFNNKRKTQTVRVFVGTLRQHFVDMNRLFNETAARPSDSLDLRIRDIGVALGTIAVHEVAHSLGLVSHPDIIRETLPQIQQLLPTMTEERMNQIAREAGVELPIPDLYGCEQGHNCPAFQAAHPLASRVGNGYFVMDPFISTAAQIGLDESQSERVEKLPAFSVFSASYLAAVHPKPDTAARAAAAAVSMEGL